MGDTSTPLSEDFLRVLQDTEMRVRHSAHAHWAATNRLEAINRAATVSTLGGGFLISLLAALPVMFQSFYAPYATYVNVGLFALGGLVSVISVFQAVQRWGERSQAYQNAANAYSSLRRKLDILRLNLPASAGDLSAILEELRQLGEIAPAVPAHIWNAAIRKLK
ncbi:MAG: hypothetical protein WDN06_10580 [Asticcacaulis sp.]